MSAHFEILKHPHQGLAAVKHGFSWPAALLGWVWALARHLWIPGVLLLAVHAALAVTAMKLFAENPALLLVVGVGLQAWFGSQGNHLLTRSLQERGFLYLGLVPASSPADAIAKFRAVGEAIPAEWRMGTVPAAFSLPASWQQLLAVAQLTIKAVVRYRLLPVLAGLLLVVVVGLPLVLKHDGTARGLVQIVITYCLSAVTAILGLVTLWLSTGTLARDVEDCSMQMVVVKPVARWRIWLGKWLGIMALNFVLLGLSGLAIFFLIQWRAASLPDKQQAILKNELLLARGSLKQPPPDLDSKVEELLKARLKELGPSATGADLATVRKDVKEMLKAQFQVVPSRMGRTWVIDTGLAHRQLLNTPIYLRIKFRSSQYSVKPETYGTMWEIGPPKSDKRIRISRPLTTDTFHEFGINLLDEKGNPVSDPVKNGGYANLIDQDGKLYITFGNPNQAALLFDLVDGLEVLYHEGGFGLNFTRGAGIIFIWLGLLAAVGLAGASYLSFPVAAFFSITVLIVGLSSGTIATVVQDGTFGSTNHDTGAKEGVLGAVDFVMVPIFKGANEILTMVNSFSPIDALSTGRSVSWTTLATALFQIWGLIGGCFAVVGMIIFQRRELATTQGRG